MCNLDWEREEFCWRHLLENGYLDHQREGIPLIRIAGDRA